MIWLTSAILGILAFLLIGELTLWKLFQRRARTIHFPIAGVDVGAQLFPMRRLRLLAALHALMLGTWLASSILWLW